MLYSVTILRYNPERQPQPSYVTYRVEAEPHERVLDILVKIQSVQDSTLSFRKSCGHGVCGSDAMMINGKNRLACSTLMRDIKGGKLTIEPLPGAPVLRDLIIDTEKFWSKYQHVMPWLVPEEPPPDKERLRARRNISRSRNRPNVFSAEHALMPAPHHGQIKTISARQPFSRHIVLSSIHVIRKRNKDWNA